MQLQEVLARHAALVAAKDSLTAAGQPDGSDSGSSKAASQYLTAYMAAAESSEHSLSREYSTADLQILAGGAAADNGFVNMHLVTRSVQLRAWDELEQLDGAISLLSHRMREFLLGDQVGYGREYRRQPLPELHSTLIRVHNSAVLVADVPWGGEHFVLQTVRAAASFHGKPFFDCVAVRMREGAAPIVAYAQ